LDLGTKVNGVAGGRCHAGQCQVSGGTAAGANLFHRFNRFDTRGEISGVSIQNGLHRTVVLGVMDPLGSFLNKGISLSSPAHLFFLSPGGLHVGAGAQFFNTPQLTLSTASSLGLGSGRFDVFRTTASEAALLTGMPIRGKEGLSSDPAEAQRNGITKAGDLVVDGGLIQVDAALLLDAQGGHLLLQAGSQLAVPGGSVELNGNNVTVAAGALVTASAQAPAAPVPAPGTTTAPAPATVVPAPAVFATGTANPATPALSVAAEAPAAPAPLALAALPSVALPSVALPSVAVPTSAANSATATPQTPALQAPAAVALAAPLPEAKSPAPARIPAGLDGGVIRISASNDALVAGQLKALGVAATASGTAASGQAGKGGRIEITGQRVALTGAVLDASGPAGGGTVLLGGDVRGANPAVPNASSTTVDGASTVRADALAKGDGGTVIVYATDSTSVHGQLSARGGPSGGNGGFVETSGGYLDLSRTPEMGALSGKGGTWLIDPQNIVIGPSIEWLSTGNFPTTDDRDKIWQLKKPNSSNTQPAFLSLVSSNWNPNDELSSWISDNSNYAINGSSDVGSFTFFAEFSIPSIPATGTLATLTTYADDQVTALKVNDQAVNIGNIPNQLFGTPATPLSLDASLFSPGMNKIEIIVHNQPFNGLNPVAFRARFAGDLPIELTPVTKNATVNLDGQTTTFTPANPNQATWLSSPTINAALNQGSNVIVDTTNTGTGIGNITVNSPINKTAGGAASLTLNAHNNIVFNSNISSTCCALNLNLNADIDRNGSGATSLASGARLSLNDGTVTANGPISMGANSRIKDAQIVAPAINSVGGVLENISSLNLDSLILNGGSLQANGKAMIKTLELANASISGSGDLQVTQSFNRSGGTIAGNFSNLAISQASGSLTPGALSAAGPVTLQAPSGQLTLDAPIAASTVLARGSSGITLSGAAVLTASAPSGRAITLDAGSGAFLNNSTSGAEALLKQPGATWAIFADNPTTTPRDNLGGLAYNFKQYNQTFDTNQGSNPILGAGNGLFFANRPTLSVNLVPSPQVSKVYDGTNTANLAASNYSITGASPNDSIIINNPSGAYTDNNVGTGKLISVSGLSISSATETSTATDPPVLVYGYSLLNSEASGAIGTITQAPLTISAVTDSRVYNGSTSSSGTPAVTSGQVFSGDTLSGLSQVFGSKNVLGANQSTLSVNSGYTLSDGNSGNNYAVSLATAPGTISEAAAVVTANSGSTVYNGAIQSISGFSASGLVAGETSADLTGVSAGASGRNAGSYTSTASGTAANYSMSFVDGSFSITQAPLTISAVTDSRVYNGSTSSSGMPAVTSGQVFSGDTLSGLSQVFGSKNVLGANQSTLSVNSGYTLSDGNSGNNYAVSLADVTGTINQLALSGAAIVPGSSIYGSALTPGAVSFGNIVGSDLVGSSASVNASMLSTSGKPIVGTYSQSASASLTGTDAGNYSFSGFTSTPNYTISKLALTGAGIGSGSSIYGSALAPGVVSFGNIVGNGASTDRVGSSASVNTSELSTSNNPIVGTYSQSASSLTGVDAGNYSFTGFTSTPNYTISKLDLTGAEIGSGSSIYGSTLAPGAVSFGNIVGSDAVGSNAYVNTTTVSSSGKPIVGTYSQSASALTGVDAGNYSFSGFTSAKNYSIRRATLTPSFTINDKPLDGNSVATIAGFNLQLVLAGDDVSIAKASATFDNALAGNDKPVTIAEFTLSGQDADNYQLSPTTAKSTASIIQPRNGLPPNNEPNNEPINDKQGNPSLGMQSSTTSSPTGSNSVEIDGKAISPTLTAASAQEGTASGSIQSQQPTSVPAQEATASGSMQSEKTASATDVSANSASREYQESDQRSAEGANTSLGLSNAGAGVAMSPARLQQLMQSAADLIRRYPGRMLNP
jgi:hypothetical protein